MKILMFGWELPPHNSGGLGVACFGLSRALSKLGAEVTFVLPAELPFSDSPFKLRFAEAHSSVRFRPVDSLLRPYLSSATYSSLRGGRDQYASTLFEEVLRYAELARRIAKEEEHDVIHAHEWLSFGAGLSARQESGKPFVAHVHATEFDRTGGRWGNDFVHRLEREGLERADAVVSVSGFTKDMIVNRYGIPKEKIEVVHNGIDSDQIPSREECEIPNSLAHLKERGMKLVLFVGRLTLQKGPDYFVRLATRVTKEVPNARFIIAGTGELERQIIEQAAAEGVGDKIIFAGFLRGKELACLYRHADAFVMPSVSEPFGLTSLEAAAHGTPTLISKQSGVSEVLQHAFKADFWDTDEMANKIIALLRYPALGEVMRSESSQEVPHLSWEQSAKRLLSLYEGLPAKKTAYA